MSEPASEKQVNYLKVLVNKLRELAEGQEEITDKIDAAADGLLSKRDASDLIEALIASVNALGGDIKSNVRTNSIRKSQRAHAAPVEDSPEVIAARRKREAERARMTAWNDEQIRLHGGTGRKPPPSGNAPMKVWHERADYLTDHYWTPIAYGWVWECRHPDHKSRNGKDGVVRGGSILGRDVTIENAKTHWNKYHSQEKES